MRLDRIVRIEIPGPGACEVCGAPLLDYGAVDGVAYSEPSGGWLCLPCAANGGVQVVRELSHPVEAVTEETSAGAVRRWPGGLVDGGGPNVAVP